MSNYIVVPVLTKPDLDNFKAISFKARPLQHYRKTLTGGGRGILRSMPMDIPGGGVNTKTACDELNNNPYVIAKKIDHDINTNYVCERIKSGIQDNMRGEDNKINKYADTQAYLRSRCMTYDQNNKGPKKCVGNNCNKEIIKKYGSVTSSSRILKLKVETIKNTDFYRGNLERLQTPNKNTQCLRWRRKGVDPKQTPCN